MTKRFLLIVTLLFFALPFSMTFAGMQINDIKVDIKSNSGLQARELAISDARRKAFIELTQNNSAFSYDLKAKGMPSDDALEAAVDTFEIEEEKISPKQYIATLSITFSEKGLRDLLRGSYEPESKDAPQESSAPSEDKTNSKDVVLLPIYLTSDESFLWQPNNPWHAFWQSAPQEEIFKSLTPLGDVQDIMATSIEDIMTGHYQRVQPLLDRYKKDSLVVAILRRISTEHNELELTIKLFQKDRLEFSSNPLTINAESLEEGFKKARIEIIKILQDQGASVLETKEAGLQTYTVTATFSSFAQWQKIRRGLKTGAVKTFDISSLSKTYAQIIIKSNLSFNILASEFARQGLVLSEGVPGSFTLSVGFSGPKKSNMSSHLTAPETGITAPQQSSAESKIRTAFEVS